MPRRDYHTSNPRSIRPLTPDQEERLRDWAIPAANRPTEEGHLARLVLTFYYTGIHPSALARKSVSGLTTTDKWLDWTRPKTGRVMRFPIPPQIRHWFKPWVDALPDQHPVTVNKAIHEAGRLYLGMPWLTPRALRHDAIARGIEKVGVNPSKELFGASGAIILRYGERKEAKAAIERIQSEGF